MKPLLALTVIAPCLACAQTPPSEMMSQALHRLAQSDKVAIVTTGAEVRANRLVEIKATIGLEISPFNNLVRVEAMTWENDKLVSRQAGDGTTLWDYDARFNSYSSTSYASNNVLFTDWNQRFFKTLKLRTTGATAFSFRVLDDTFGSGMINGRWSPWIPTATVTRGADTVTCLAESPSPNETVYLLSGSDDEGYTFDGATFKAYDSNRKVVLKRWETTVTAGSLPANTEFGFVPPRGAKVTAVDQRSGGQ